MRIALLRPLAVPHFAAPLAAISMRRWMKGFAIALATFLILGTITALWTNPFFIRMTPAGSWEIAILTALSVEAGLYASLRMAACGGRTAGSGGVLGFLGIACPVCNKVLLYLFGSQLLLSYFEPVRIYVAIAGLVLLGAAILLEYGRQLSFLGGADRAPALP